MNVERISRLISVFSSSPSAKEGRSWDHTAEINRWSGGVVLARWREPHARGWTNHSVEVPVSQIPELCALLMEYYVADERERAKERFSLIQGQED